MKILMTTDTIGGVWTYALELIGALAEDGVEVVLAGMGPLPDPSQRREAAALDNLILECGAYRLEWMEDPWEEVRQAGQWLLQLEEIHRPQVIHLNGYAHGSLPWRAPLLMVAHSCVLSWWESVKQEPLPPQWNRYRRAVASGLAAADCVVAPSAAMLAATRRHYGSLPRTRVIPNARDPSRFPPGVKQPFIFAAGRMWDEAKNLSLLADAVAKETAWPVYVAGDRLQENPPAHRTDRMHEPALSSSPIHFLGKLDTTDVAEWMGRASIYVLPARYEPFGLSILEAALAGCALVVGDIPSLREIWGDAALFVPADDAATLRRTLNGLIHDADRRNEMAVRARIRALSYSPRRMADAYLRQYRSLQPAARTSTTAVRLVDPPISIPPVYL